jgi:hypothetical protein
MTTIGLLAFANEETLSAQHHHITRPFPNHLLPQSLATCQCNIYLLGETSFDAGQNAQAVACITSRCNSTRIGTAAQAAARGCHRFYACLQDTVF